MTTLKEIRHSMAFEGVFRVGSCQTLYARTGSRYLRLKIEDATGGSIAYAWDTHYLGPWSFDPFALIQVKGESRIHNGQQVIDLRSASEIKDFAGTASSLLPVSACPQPELVSQLLDIENQIMSPSLRSFMQEILLDMSIAIPFMQVKASAKDHHCEQGGLLRHSIECAQIAGGIPLLNGSMRELAIIAALFHDIGKIRTFENNGRRTKVGYLVDHQALTLEVCSRQLQTLEQAWPDAALALRHVLTCRTIKSWGYEPRMAIAHVVHLADRLSCELDLEWRSFESKADWANVSDPLGNSPHTYWRPLHTSQA